MCEVLCTTNTCNHDISCSQHLHALTSPPLVCEVMRNEGVAHECCETCMGSTPGATIRREFVHTFCSSAFLPTPLTKPLLKEQDIICKPDLISSVRYLELSKVQRTHANF